MAHIYVGFHDQRSCNRILKPPGGGTSNIFGTDFIPDVVPHVSPRKDHNQGGTIQQVLQSETVTTATRTEAKNSTTKGDTIVEQKVCKLDTNGDTNGHNSFHEVALVPEEVTEQRSGTSTPDVVEVTSKIEQVRIQERSSTTEMSETDSSGNTKVISSNRNSEGSVERNSSCKKGSSIEDILKQDDMEAKKKVRGQVQRVPPGGYSSGLW